MKLTRLELRHFRGLESARLEFGPGLNLLLGPNEAGKSTVAEALRAVLLRRAGSSLTQDLHPLEGGGEPSVTLDYADGEGRAFRLRKTFGDKIVAELSASTDGRRYAVRERGPGADTVLREQLGWGLAEPGGKGGPRKLESTFLTRALLAEQTEVEAILTHGLEEGASSQQHLLEQALEAAAEDPRFKQALAAAVRDKEQFYSQTGRKRVGASSPWKRTSTALSEAEEELRQLQEKQSRVEGLESQLDARLEDARGAAEEVQSTRERVEALEVEAQRYAERELRREEVEAARAGLEQALDVARQVETLEARRVQAEQALAEVVESESAARQAESEAEAAQAQCRSERDAALRSGDGAQLQLQRAELDKQQSTLEGRRSTLEHRKEKVRAVEAQKARFTELEAERRTAEQTARDAQQGLEAASAEVDRWEAELVAARSAEAAARLERAELRARRAEQAAAKAREAAETSEGLRVEVAELEARISPLASLGPSTLDDVSELERTLERCRAAASAGLAVRVERRSAVPLGVAGDGASQRCLPAEVASEVFEAERTLQLDIGDVASLQIEVGSESVRAALGAAERAWRERGLPVLQRYEVATLEALRASLRRVEEDRRRKSELQRQIEDQDERASQLVGLEEELHEALRERDEAAAESDRLGVPELEAPRPLSEVEEGLSRARADKEAEAHRASSAASRLEGLQARVEEARQLLEDHRESLGAEGGGEELEAELAGVEAALRALEVQRSELETQLAQRVEAANRALAGAERGLDTARRQLEDARGAAEARRSEIATVQGRLEQARAQLERADRPGLERRLAKARATLDALPESKFSPSDLEAARSSLEQAAQRAREADKALDTLHGALAETEGEVIKGRVEDARSRVEDRQRSLRQLEIEASASLLLVEVLEEAEKAVAGHMGVSLGKLVSDRFSDLTGDRYARVELDKSLVTGKLRFGEAELGPESLSVGTRHQLATLLRVILAEQIGHPVVLDDQLVHSDDQRMAWLQAQLLRSAERTQIIVLSCRSPAYRPDEGRMRVIHVPEVVSKFSGAPSTESR